MRTSVAVPLSLPLGMLGRADAGKRSPRTGASMARVYRERRPGTVTPRPMPACPFGPPSRLPARACECAACARAGRTAALRCGVAPDTPAPPASPPAAPPAPPAGDRPLAGGERLQVVDALRGAALLGILLVNVLAFSGPSFLYGPPLGYWRGVDRWVEWGVLVLAEGAFYSIFSLLFGLGLGLQLRRRDPATALPRFRRRLWALLGIGLLHRVLIWLGDILTDYALVGFALTLLAGASVTALLLGGVALWGVSLLFALSFALDAAPAAPLPGGAALWAQPWLELFGRGSWVELVAYRWEQLGPGLAGTLYLLPGLLGLFALGLALARLGVFQAPARHRPAIRRLLWLTLPLALACKALYGAQLLAGETRWRLLLSTTGGGPLLGASYAALLTLAWSAEGRPAWLQRLADGLAAAGRMALTNYLAQSLLFTLLYYGYGLGLYGRLGPAAGEALALALFALQVGGSRWWLARFRFGPLEWLWRGLTYGRLPPLSRARDRRG